jgi:hypothetical protein
VVLAILLSFLTEILREDEFRTGDDRRA